ncbi:MAG: glycerophosphodiester phosphodiesterase [Rhodospirillales bacterium]|nr:glycerophosphodiester phosphodiesterase [Rhodospirillales bacterium]MCB9997114.1 glycerophosphodiester phosphodiesterase [Rhodospirillales bacterium]
MMILGHRGTGVTRKKELDRPAENTLKAFAQALEDGADGLELDVRRTQDNDLAVTHHKTLDPDSPRLRDVFTLAARYGAPLLNIELAGKNTYDLAYSQAVKSGYPLDKIVFSSFDHDQLHKLRKLDPRVKIGLLFSSAPEPVATLKGRVRFSESYIDRIRQTLGPASLHIIHDQFNEKIRTYARKHGLELFIWTRNEKSPEQDVTILDFARHHKNAPDIHLITDYPGKIKAALR